MTTRRDVFQAIADPTRRDIIGLLSNRSLSVNSISENFDITRQAISLHVKILEECQLISIRREGRERICKAKLKNLKEVAEWTSQFQVFWANKLQALKEVVEESNVNNSI